MDCPAVASSTTGAQPTAETADPAVSSGRRGRGIPQQLWTAVDAVTTGEDCRILAIGNPDDQPEPLGGTPRETGGAERVGPHRRGPAERARPIPT